MEELLKGTCGCVPAPERGAFRWDRLLVWIPACAVLGLLIARAAVVAAGYFAPLVVFPLAVGVVLGGAMVLVMRVFRVGHRPTIWCGALLAATLVIGGQHYFSFQKDLRRAFRDRDKLAKLKLVAPEWIPPSRFWDYMEWSAARGRMIGNFSAQGGLAWLAWCVDGLLVLVPSLALVGMTARLPYCNCCRHWYRTVRSGPLDDDTAALLAGLVGVESPPAVRKARYRWLACEGGCGPTALVLSWDEAGERVSSGMVWLDPVGRRTVLEILDRSARREAKEEVTKPESG